MLVHSSIVSFASIMYDLVLGTLIDSDWGAHHKLRCTGMERLGFSMSSQVSALHLPNQSSVLNENLIQHFMFQHCQPMKNHDTGQLQEGNRKINSEKVSGQSSSIQLVHPLYTIYTSMAATVPSPQQLHCTL